jgi:Ca2+-binding RTX toxin-like protein
VLLGGRGNDTLLGGPGRDKLLGGPGADRLRGCPGQDACPNASSADLNRFSSSRSHPPTPLPRPRFRRRSAVFPPIRRTNAHRSFGLWVSPPGGGPRPRPVEAELTISVDDESPNRNGSGVQSRPMRRSSRGSCSIRSRSAPIATRSPPRRRRPPALTTAPVRKGRTYVLRGRVRCACAGVVWRAATRSTRNWYRCQYVTRRGPIAADVAGHPRGPGDQGGDGPRRPTRLSQPVHPLALIHSAVPAYGRFSRGSSSTRGRHLSIKSSLVNPAVSWLSESHT